MRIRWGFLEIAEICQIGRLLILRTPTLLRFLHLPMRSQAILCQSVSLPQSPVSPLLPK